LRPLQGPQRRRGHRSCQRLGRSCSCRFRSPPRRRQVQHRWFRYTACCIRRPDYRRSGISSRSGRRSTLRSLARRNSHRSEDRTRSIRTSRGLARKEPRPRPSRPTLAQPGHRRMQEPPRKAREAPRPSSSAKYAPRGEGGKDMGLDDALAELLPTDARAQRLRSRLQERVARGAGPVRSLRPLALHVARASSWP